MPPTPAAFADLPLAVGHWTHPEGRTGCTVAPGPPLARYGRSSGPPQMQS